MALRLIDYVPDPLDLDPEVIIATRRRLAAYLEDFWPELDTRPNSVFGDIFLTPESTLMTTCEVAAERFRNDLDLGNVAAGRIFDLDFVTAFLKNFGVDAGQAVHASGIVKLIFETDQQYLIGHEITFRFGSNSFRINPGEDNPLIIYPTGSAQGQRILTPASDGRFEVHVPVIGPPGAEVNDGDLAVIDGEIEGLLEVTAVGTFDSGRIEESIVQMADRARRQFSAIGFSSRSGATSFATFLWPGLVGVSSTVTGDKEMIRSGINPLGIKEGALDLFIKSSSNYLTGEVPLTLTYDVGRALWVGQLTIPVVPAFFSTAAGIFQASKFNMSQGANAIYARSGHSTVDNISVSYSKHEVLGIEVEDTNPTSFLPASNGPVKYSSPGVAALLISGEYAGSKFNRYSQRSVVMRFDMTTEIAGVTAIVANVKDKISGELATVHFLPNSETNPNKGIIDFSSAGYKSMFNGLSLEVTPSSGDYVPAQLIGLQFEFAYQGRTSSFVVSYLYDPSLIKVDTVVHNADNKPVNVEIFTRSFIVCHVTQFTLNCRIPYGQTMEWDAIRNGIANYVNSLTYPRQYQDASVSSYIRSMGALEVQGIIKRGTFYPSVARVYVDKDGNETPISRIDTTDLKPPLNDLGFGPRNITYLLEPDTVKFNVVTS